VFEFLKEESCKHRADYLLFGKLYDGQDSGVKFCALWRPGVE
jgi:hypothetical protein